MPCILHAKFVASLTFRGFHMPPGEVEELVGFAATELGAAGNPRKLGTNPLQRSFASWRVEFEDSARLDEMIPTLINGVGGADHLVVVKGHVAPEFFEVDIAMWIKDSKEQEGGVIDTPSIEMLAKIGATLSFGFYARNAD
jgi:Domain of unknown function (DUF4279)